MLTELVEPTVRSREGKTLLHIWRTGEIYQEQNGHALFNEWNNVYFSPLPQAQSARALHHDLASPLPFPGGSCDAIYACRVMEHLTQKDGDRVLTDFFRLLKPGGVCRLSTPDLEEIAEEYLRQLKRTWESPGDQNLKRFYWIKLQMLDQMTRVQSGGDMQDAINRGYFDPDYAKARFQDVFDEFLPSFRTHGAATEAGRVTARRGILARLARRVHRAATFRSRGASRGREFSDPRRSLEADKWLHDRLSLRISMERAGFRHYRVADFRSSEIPGWERFQLDKSQHGDHPLEPSLYVEARKP